MSALCSITDVYDWIQPGTVPTPARLVSSVATDTEIITLDGHGLATDDIVTFRTEGGTLPSPLADGTTYYAIRLTDATFSVATAAGGGALNLTTSGSGVLVIIPLPWTRWIEVSSAEVENELAAHLVPITGTVAPIIRAYVAGLVAEKATGRSNAVDPGLAARLIGVRKRFEKWAAGATIRGPNAPSTSTTTMRAGAIAADPRGWAQRGNGVLP